MNERIKQLAEQAETKEIGYYFFDKEKFAELIVQECINEIDYIGKANEVFGDRTDRGATEKAIEKIKEHFGVEL